MLFITLLVCLFISASAFAPAMHAGSSMRRSTLQMAKAVTNLETTKTPFAPPGMKPMADGSYKMAGEQPKVYLLEHENGSVAQIETKTGSCVSWKNADGVEVMKGVAHCLPTLGTAMKAEFVAEERAKKLSFDRMIFKTEPGPEGYENIEYRIDATLRDDCLEYDVIIKNLGDKAYDVQTGLSIELTPEGEKAGYKVTKTSGYTDGTNTGTINIPVGKFKETTFYAKISK